MQDPMEKLGFTEAGQEQIATVDTPTITPPPTPATPPPAVAPETPQSTTPVTAEPTATPEIKFGAPSTTTDPVPTPAIFNAKEIFGVEMSAEEIKRILTEYPTLKSEYETIKNTDPFHDARSKNFNQALKDGIDPDVYWTASKIDPEKTANADAVIMQLRLEKGITSEDAKIIVESKYHLDKQLIQQQGELPLTPEEERHNENVKMLQRTGLALLNADAADAKKFLSKYKTDSLTPPQKIMEQQVEQIEKVWMPAMNELSKTLSNFTFGDFKYDFPEQDVINVFQKTIKTLKDYGATDVLPSDAKGQELVRNMMEADLKAQHFDKAFKKLDAHYAKKLLDFKHNPSKDTTTASTSTAVASDSIPTPEQAFAQMRKEGFA